FCSCFRLLLPSVVALVPVGILTFLLVLSGCSRNAQSVRGQRESTYRKYPHRLLSFGNSGSALFGMRDEGCEARVVLERFAVGIFFDAKVCSGIETMVNRLAQKRQRLISASLERQHACEVISGENSVRVLRPQRASLNLERFPLQLLGLGVAAFPL